jgi:hypothetical protein
MCQGYDGGGGGGEDWKGLKRHLSPVAVVDPCVHSFTKPGYLRRKDIIYDCLYFELGLERRPDPTPGSESAKEERPRCSIDSNSSAAPADGCDDQTGPVFEETRWRWPSSRDGEGEDQEFFLLYRGTRSLRQDSPLLTATHDRGPEEEEEQAASFPLKNSRLPSVNPSRAHSLSYGLGLFAGVMQDSSATPYNYMRKRGMQAYALKVQRRDYCSAGASSLVRRLFYVPPLPALAMLRGLGELFHPRGRVCLDSGCAGSDAARKRAHFVSGLLACSYAALPSFLATDTSAVASFSAFLDQSACLLGARE